MNAFKIWLRQPFNLVLMTLMVSQVGMGTVAYQLGDVTSVITLLGHVSSIVVALIALHAVTATAR